jgi:hypothetical protein
MLQLVVLVTEVWAALVGGALWHDPQAAAAAAVAVQLGAVALPA